MTSSQKASVLFWENYRSKAHIVINQGGTNSGKTHSIIQALFCIACEKPKQVITVVGQDIPNLKAGALRDALAIRASTKKIAAQIKSYNKSERIFEFINGSLKPFTTASRRNPKRPNCPETNKTLFNNKSLIKHMSLQSFLSKIWGEVKALFDGIPSELKTAIHIGVVVTENIKNFVDSPGADILTAIIPGDIDDEIKNWLRAKLPAILTELKLADSCSALTDPAEITACAVKVLQGLDGDVKSAFLHNLSILVAEVAADGKLTWSDGVLILEWYYKNEYAAAA